jgi:hypothetical protein
MFTGVGKELLIHERDGRDCALHIQQVKTGQI